MTNIKTGSTALPAIIWRGGIGGSGDIKRTDRRRAYFTLCVPWLLLLCLTCHVQAATFELAADDDLVGDLQRVISRYEDTLMDVARRNDQGYLEMTAANPYLDILLPGAGQEVLIPALYLLPHGPRRGIVINLAELRLYYYPPEGEGGEVRQVITFPVGIGRSGWRTPLGVTRVLERLTKPSWTPSPAIHQDYLAQGVLLPERVLPGPDNPLGDYALRLAWQRYLLHGTNKPDGVGMPVSHGCIRLFPEDIAALYRRVSPGTEVLITSQRYKAGWRGDTLYLEVHPARYADRLPPPTELARSIIQATTTRRAAVDWQQVEWQQRLADGIPRPIGRVLQLPPADDLQEARGEQ